MVVVVVVVVCVCVVSEDKWAVAPSAGSSGQWAVLHCAINSGWQRPHGDGNTNGSAALCH